jgi:hypothetical protein
MELPLMNRKAKTRKPPILWLMIVLLLFIGIGALSSGAMLFLSPDGSLLGMSMDLLAGSPFGNYLIPGIVLFIFIGVFSVLAGYGLLKRPDWRRPEVLNPCKGYHWAWMAAWTEGIIMLVWIGVETLLLGYISFLQPLIAGWGIVIIGLAWLPPVRRYYRERKPARA